MNFLNHDDLKLLSTAEVTALVNLNLGRWGEWERVM